MTSRPPPADLPPRETDALLLGAPPALGGAGEAHRREQIRARLFGETPKRTCIGRFVLLDRIGSGGMGVVYAAYDEQLDRKVALKVLHTSGEEHEADRQARFLREAKALARVAHPNVVGIHDMGLFEGRVFLAMEFIQGRSLRAWLQAQPRSISEVLRVYQQAGQGLLAAHRQGIVHRDFKPDNAMIGEDGRVRVVDFGLALASLDAPGSKKTGVVSSISAGEALTAAGTILGTPAYMAPEQILGDPADERVDQFAFCVALYEGLHGERPFQASSLEDLLSEILLGTVRAPPKGSRVPGWLRAVLLRGLRADPAGRWPSMGALLAALDQETRRRRWRLGGGLAVGLLSLASVAFSLRPRAPALPVCSGADALAAEVWGAKQREEVRRSLLASGLGYAPETWARVERGLDHYSRAWQEAHRGACLDHQRGAHSGELLDLRMACLARRRQAMDALVRVLSTNQTPAVLEQAGQAVRKLEPLDACADVAWLRASRPAPREPRTAAQVEQLQGRLVAAKVLLDTGLYEQGAEDARKIAEEASSLEYPPLLADAIHQRGVFELRLGRLQDAQKSQEEAFEKALSSGDDATAARAASALLSVLCGQGRADATEPWERSASALVTRTSDRWLLADFLGRRAVARTDRGQIELALEDHRRAVASYEELLGPKHPEVALRLHNLGLALHRQGLTEERIAVSRRALAILEESLGPEHPEVALLLNGLAAGLIDARKLPEAREALERAQGILERSFGPSHPRAVQTLMNLALVASAEGKSEASVDLYQRALRILDAEPSPNLPRVTRLLSNLGASLQEAGRNQEALVVLERASTLGKQARPDSPDLAHAMNNLASVFARLGRTEQAAEAYRSALAIFEQTLPPSHPHLAVPLLALGEMLLEHGDAAGAVPLLERALTVQIAARLPGLKCAPTRFALARALDAHARDELSRSRARQLAEQALADYEEANAMLSFPAARVMAWLKAAKGEPLR